VNGDGMGEECSTHERAKTNAKFCFEGVKQSGTLKDLGADGGVIFKQTLRAEGGRVWIGFVWLRIGTTDELW
jgi:hypothetical protein